ncbi:MAG: YihA family ribosome biogenesis GTP-binding protein [Bacteroidales bacterium]|nr:YihA family ribosome biogenesis GTP-binding protein [Bacteroidales bacterium]
MLIKNATYVLSSPDVAKCPKPVMPEYAFIGRSNVGKSSLINLVTGRKQLARISRTPGKTQTINHFLVNDEWYLVDLPGIGFAKISKTIRQRWKKMIRDYLLLRQNLLNTFFLIDSRIAPQAIDLEFINWLGVNQLPFTIVFTKTDKLTKIRLKEAISRYRIELQGTWEEIPAFIISSARNRTGGNEIIALIEESNKIFGS